MTTHASKLCGQCENVAYCSIECQRVHWRVQHKFDCEKKNTSTDPLISFSDAWLQVQEAMKQVDVDVAAKEEMKAIKLMKQTLAMAEHQFGRPDVDQLRRVRPDTGDSISSWEVDSTLMRLCTKLGDLNKALDTPDGLRNAEVFYLKARRAFDVWRKRLDGRGPGGEKLVAFDVEQENLILFHLARAELNIVRVLLDIGDVPKAEKHAVRFLASVVASCCCRLSIAHTHTVARTRLLPYPVLGRRPSASSFRRACRRNAAPRCTPTPCTTPSPSPSRCTHCTPSLLFAVSLNGPY